MKREIALYGERVLRERCAKVEKITPEIKELAADLIRMAKGNAGLAAPQIFEAVRMFAAVFVKCDKQGEFLRDEEGTVQMEEPRIFINPELSSPSEDTEILSEGCLSIPDFMATVERPYAITIKAMDLEGNTFEERIEGFNARILMHENDHLNGVLNIDRMTHADKKIFEPDLKRLKKEYKKQSK